MVDVFAAPRHHELLEPPAFEPIVAVGHDELAHAPLTTTAAPAPMAGAFGKVAKAYGHGDDLVGASPYGALQTAPPSPVQSALDLSLAAHGRSHSVPARARPVAPLPAVRPYDAPPIASGPVRAVMRDLLADVDVDDCDAHGENAFFVCDLAQVWRQNERWLRAFGKRGAGGRAVEAFFAVKCNPDPNVIRLLAQLGLGFDCASHAEIALVLSLGVAPNRIIYANPCKAASFVRFAAQAGVDLMTFDNTDELAKIKRNHPRARLVLRILTDDAGSQCRLGLKFGAPLADVRSLLTRARAHGLDVVGVSFHVGSGCTNPDLYDDAIRRAAHVFAVARDVGYDLDLLDIGGGFRVDNLEEIADVVHAALEAHFPADAREAQKPLRVIGEPGRFYVAEAYELACNIIARRGIEEGDDEPLPVAEGEPAVPVMYYINDGIYASFNCVLFDHQVVFPEVLTLGGAFQDASVVRDPDGVDKLERCSIWGPTCDAIDCVTTEADLPVGRLVPGDWLLFRAMGAYTICAASQFNGFRQSEVHYTVDARGEAGVETRICELLASEC